MKALGLVLKSGSELWAPVVSLEKLRLFQEHPDLLEAGEYEVKSDVSSEVLGLFLERLSGRPESSKVTQENAEGLRALCDELGFSGFDAELKAILCAGDAKTWRELAGLINRVDRHDILLERLQVAELPGLVNRVDRHDILLERLQVAGGRAESVLRGVEGSRGAGRWG